MCYDTHVCVDKETNNSTDILHVGTHNHSMHISIIYDSILGEVSRLVRPLWRMLIPPQAMSAKRPTSEWTFKNSSATHLRSSTMSSKLPRTA